MNASVRYLARRIAYTPLLRGLTERLAAPVNTAEGWDKALAGWQTPAMGKTHSVDTRNGVIATLLKHYATENPAVLDVGCAGGTLALALPSFERYHGTDISPYAVNLAANDIKRENVTFEACDARDFKIAPDAWDVIVFAEMLYFLSVNDATETVVRYAKGLRKGGVVIVSMKDEGGKSRAIFSALSARFQWIDAVLWQVKHHGAGYNISPNLERPPFLTAAMRPK